MAKKVLMATIVLLALSIMISQGVACVGAISPRQPRIIPAIVSTEWLNTNLPSLENLVVLDVRDTASYGAGHIPGAINVPEGTWYVNPPLPPFDSPEPYMEVPKKHDLFELIGNAGITIDSLVVVVGYTSGLLLPEAPLALYNTAGITRVAITLLYAGVENVAILDGGYDKWVEDGYTTESAANTPIPVKYREKVYQKMFVSAKYVEKRIGESVIVSARDEIVYCGDVTEPWTPYPGHIPTAENVPTPELWDIQLDGPENALYITYKTAGDLLEMVQNKVGFDYDKEIIVYCGVGGYASTLYFVLSEVLGYSNVKIYDGSAQEWTWLGKPVVTCP